MQLTFLTIHPTIFDAYTSIGPFRMARDKQLLNVDIKNLRDYSIDHRGSVDDRPYGGGDGMVMRPEPIGRALADIPKPRTVISLSPGGKPWNQDHAERLCHSDHLVFLCGRFAGIDQRAIDLWVDEEFSIGDVIVSGGELPALLIADSIVRLIPGSLGNTTSAVIDSFSPELEGMLEYPVYTRPEEYAGLTVPEVLRSGDHKAIEAWRKQKALERTQKYRPDLIKYGR